ncbi:hypothetical protein BJV74DRAFT_888045 [Russula compacta]|nr:hypothetical protein BJV74DRAFT_888045 [Russula compacta]
MALNPSCTSAPVPPPDEARQRKPRTLILCFDGTENQYNKHNTNVVKLYSLFRKDISEDQLCYYQAGIGTYFSPGIVSPLFKWVAQAMDKAVAWYFYAHIEEGYRFLMENYNVGDKVCIFGFSRGAYTARALAGMLHKVGLLSKDNLEQIPFAYRLYKSTDAELARGFRETFCRHPVHIDFLGVWDTVESVGALVSRSLPCVGVNTAIRVFRHAIALDEHRSKYRPNFYHHSVDESSKNTTDIEEVWFVGCHSDVGGGSARDPAPCALSNISLRWMIEQIVATNCPIHFDRAALPRWNISATIVPPNYPSGGVSTSKDRGDRDNDSQDPEDVVQSITDQLKKAPWWWVLEIFPFPYRYRGSKEHWTTGWWPNFGRGRIIPPHTSFHKSVTTRMQDQRLKYKPRARHENGREVDGS